LVLALAPLEGDPGHRVGLRVSAQRRDEGARAAIEEGR
jgi:hypothetical protein